jgi:hypothetical protein
MILASQAETLRRAAAAILALGLICATAQAAPLPSRAGACSETTIARIGHRLEGMPDSGSAIRYANGGVQVSYDTIAAIHRSRPRDRVRLCLIFIPKDCPKGDDRGRIYRATNLRTGESWEAPDAQHSCGGA